MSGQRYECPCKLYFVLTVCQEVLWKLFCTLQYVVHGNINILIDYNQTMMPHFVTPSEHCIFIQKAISSVWFILKVLKLLPPSSDLKCQYSIRSVSIKINNLDTNDFSQDVCIYDTILYAHMHTTRFNYGFMCPMRSVVLWLNTCIGVCHSIPVNFYIEG